MRSGSSFCYSNPNSLGTNMQTMVINDELIDNMLIDDQDSDDVELITQTPAGRKDTSAHLTDINNLMAQFNAELTNLRNNKTPKSISPYTESPNNGKTSKILMITICIFLLYTVICCSYLAYVHFFALSKCPCSALNEDVENVIVNSNITLNATLIPTLKPTEIPTLEPSINEPTMEPTVDDSYAPTMEPTFFPTTSMEDRYHFVGDFKLSSKSMSHGRWLKCDGTMYKISDYPQLFDEIGHTFTTNMEMSQTMFAVPDARDRVIGMYGNGHSFGEVMGSENVQLSEEHLPTHHHYISNNDVSTESFDNSTRQYLSITNGAYILYGSDSAPNSFKSSDVGMNEPFEVYQPTIFMANAFIYA